jgi:hypothetical protein
MNWRSGVGGLTLSFILLGAGSVQASPQLDAMVACRKGVTKFGQLYGHKRRILLLNCIDKLIKCELQQEVEGTNPNGCRSTAETSCGNTIGPASDTPLSRHRQKFHDKATLACAAAPFVDVLSNLAGGLWYSNDVECGASVDLPTLIDCLRDEWLEVETDTLIGQLKPRAGLLLDNTNLGDDFPNFPRPPATDVLVSAVIAGGGNLNNPGTISPPAGNTVRFSGDMATLPCGMSSNNGKVTITIVALGGMCTDQPIQESDIKEDYGPTVTATFGPFLTDVTYCLRLQDSMGCQDTETGTIDVP